jgi:hypothetical protein
MTLIAFMHGAVTMGCTVAGVFFFRFWRQSLDRLFLRFAWAFWILAVSYGLLGWSRTRPSGASTSSSSGLRRSA